MAMSVKRISELVDKGIITVKDSKNGKEKFKRLAIRKRKSVVSDSKIGLDGRQRTPTDSSK